jgi:hypothetical protein
MDADCYKFLHLVSSQSLAATDICLITVSNGSDDSGSMSFGWIIVLPCGRRLVRCAGPAYGPTGSSFCAEGYGFLSLSRFLVRLCNFCSVQSTWPIKMLTHNQGLLTRLESSLPYPVTIVAVHTCTTDRRLLATHIACSSGAAASSLASLIYYNTRCITSTLLAIYTLHVTWHRTTPHPTTRRCCSTFAK